jgi:hypothetical protein
MAVTSGLWGRIFPRKNGSTDIVPQKDRRRCERYRMDLPARFCVYVPSDPARRTMSIPGQIYDISESGIGLLIGKMEYEGLHLIDPNRQTWEQCRLEIEIPFGREPLQIKGRAVWYVRNADAHPPVYRVGIEFVGLTAALKDRIRTFLNICISATEA